MAADESKESGQDKRGIWSRRDFFTRLGWGGFGIFTGFSLLGFIRSAFPRVLFQPPVTFKAGFPSDYAVGEVSDKYKQEQRVWIVREETGIYAVFAKCTHLGCTPRWEAAENKLKCPWHGSGFFKTGVEFGGGGAGPRGRGKVGGECGSNNDERSISTPGSRRCLFCDLPKT